MQIKEYLNISNYVKYVGFILFALVAVIIVDFFRLLSWVQFFNTKYSTYISILLIYLSLLIIAYVAYKGSMFPGIPVSIKNLFYVWLIWNVINIIRGVFLANDYWDWKFLFFTSIGFSLISLVFFIGNNVYFVWAIFYFYIRWIFLFGFLLIPLTLTTNEELYSRLMIPISFFILIIPYIQTKWKLLIIIVAITSIFIVIGFRTNIIKITLSISLLSLFYVKNFIRQYWIRLAHFILFFGPLFLLVSGLTGYFNILSEFSKNEEIVVTDNYGREQNLMGDTRTFLYEEVLGSMGNLSNWMIGKSASGSYSSKFFINNGGAMNGKRYRCEINILNILLYHGIIGVVIYFLLLFTVSFYAINYSNNILSKMLGLTIASRWSLSFIEEFTQYDLNFFFFWLIIGLVSSSFFRKLSDKELEKFFRLK